jgi:hypothetical protein
MLAELDLRPSERKLRQFGFFALFAFAFAGLWMLRARGELPSLARSVAYLLLFLALFSGSMSVVWPRANRPLFVVLSLVTYPVGLVVSHVVLLILFFVILTPLGLLFRIVGRDPLRRRREAERDSYWEDLSETAEPSHYFRQF